MSKITLQCVKEGRSKLRIRFHSFTDDEGKVFTNVYDDAFNCQFPRDIREEGRFYEIGPDDLNLIVSRGKTPFYKVRVAAIKIVNAGDVALKPTKGRTPTAPAACSSSTSSVPIDISTLTIFEVTECVACLGCAPTEIFIPCAHKCVCKDCSLEIKKHSNLCPLCRRNVTSTISV